MTLLRCCGRLPNGDIKFTHAHLGLIKLRYTKIQTGIVWKSGVGRAEIVLDFQLGGSDSILIGFDSIRVLMLV